MLMELKRFRGQVHGADFRRLSNQGNTTNADSHLVPNMDTLQGNKDPELYQKICQEFIQMKHNYDRVKTAQMALRNAALEQSSLDNLIKASLNPMGGIAARPRTDSLQVFREQNMGRPRAMTMDRPSFDKYVPVKKSKFSAFRSFKHFEKQDAVQETKDEEEEPSPKEADFKDLEVKLNKKRTFAMMQKEFPSKSSQLLLSPSEDVGPRKRARSF